VSAELLCALTDCLVDMLVHSERRVRLGMSVDSPTCSRDILSNQGGMRLCVEGTSRKRALAETSKEEVGPILGNVVLRERLQKYDQVHLSQPFGGLDRGVNGNSADSVRSSTTLFVCQLNTGWTLNRATGCSATMTLQF
jgi:hypothetical protein